jgi:carbamoyl-phosphate synthase large subunit
MKDSVLPPRPRRVLVLGSGALEIAQGGEFDYSGTQALKALREEGVHSVLVNPNIATIQTSERYADAVYLLPIQVPFVEDVIRTERIDAILLSFGGQSALNCGVALDEAGVLARHGVTVLGTPLSAIRATEDRKRFNEELARIGVCVAKSRAAASREEAVEIARELGLPVILRAAFSLGGQGAAVVRDEAALAAALDRAFVSSSQVLVEECLSGWKELEYEVVRDAYDNCITVCNMENFDPVGVHTGDSIVIAPAQTLDDRDQHMLRDVAIRTIRHLGIIGECNIQFALHPRTSEYRVIEVNARLSRSSALASKATGYPLAYVAAKLALGQRLSDLPNAVTQTTTAFFEPALDYVVCKVPRWDLEKFEGVKTDLGPEMKSVGEVMGIGRSFPEALQKALRMLEIGVDGLDGRAFTSNDVRHELEHPTPRRVFALAKAFEEGMSVEEAARLTSIDRFFLAEVRAAIELGTELGRTGSLDALDEAAIRAAKCSGYSDAAIARRVGATEESVRERRRALGIRLHLAQIDTLAAEYPAETNYLYSSYAASADDVEPAPGSILFLGSGCYRIGSSVEFDWCTVNAVETARELGFPTILLNCNPGTVSTDYDVCDRLVFDEISLEVIAELYASQRCAGVIVCMGGQTPNNLALALERAGMKLLGTPASSIDRAEDRHKFGQLCDDLGIPQPRWTEARGADDLAAACEALGGFPLLVRPSYVLSGAAMRVAHGADELWGYLSRATALSPDHPVVISKFEHHAREFDLDAVADDGKIVAWTVSEHVEDAGVHSGDATLVLPPGGLNLQTIQRARQIGTELARALTITGPFNVQFLARANEVKVIECNLRASRSLPFVSKVMGFNFIREATRRILGHRTGEGAPAPSPLEMDYVAVKAPKFSFRRMQRADPLLGVEMKSTGEVACLGATLEEALLEALLAAGFKIPTRGVLLSLGPVGDKYRFTEEAQVLGARGMTLYATLGTAEILRSQGISCVALAKHEDAADGLPGAIATLRSGAVDLVINIPREYDASGVPDGYAIRRAAVDLDVPLITDLRLARRIIRALERWRPAPGAARPLAAYRMVRA